MYTTLYIVKLTQLIIIINILNIIYMCIKVLQNPNAENTFVNSFVHLHMYTNIHTDRQTNVCALFSFTVNTNTRVNRINDQFVVLIKE